MQINNSLLSTVPFDYFFAEASLDSADFPTEVLEQHLKSVISEISKETNLFTKAIQLTLPPIYDIQERYDLATYLQEGWLKTILWVNSPSTSHITPKIINKLKIPSFFAVTFDYPSNLYIFNRPSNILNLEVVCSYCIPLDSAIYDTGVPRILYDKYRHVVLAGLFSKMYAFAPADAKSIERRNYVEWFNQYKLGIRTIQADLINELSPKEIVYKNRFTL